MDEQRLPFSTPGQQLDGDLTVAIRLLPEARKLLFHVRAIASNAGVSVFSMRRVLSDGSVIAATVHGPVDRITVYGAPQGTPSVRSITEPVVLPFGGYWGYVTDDPNTALSDKKQAFIIDPTLSKIRYLDDVQGGAPTDAPLELQVLGREVWCRNIYASANMPNVVLAPGTSWPVGTTFSSERLTRNGTTVLEGETRTTRTVTSIVLNGDGTLNIAEFLITRRNTTFTTGYDYFTRKFIVYRQDSLSTQTSFLYGSGGGENLNPDSSGYSTPRVYDVPAEGGSLTLRAEGSTEFNAYGVSVPQWLATAGVLSTRPGESANPGPLYRHRYKKRYFHRFANGTTPGFGVPLAKMYAYNSTTALAEVNLPNLPFFAANPIPTEFAGATTAKWAYYPGFEKTLFVWYSSTDNVVTLGLLRHGQTDFEKVKTLTSLVAAGPPVPALLGSEPIDATAWFIEGINPKGIQ